MPRQPPDMSRLPSRAWVEGPIRTTRAGWRKSPPVCGHAAARFGGASDVTRVVLTRAGMRVEGRLVIPVRPSARQRVVLSPVLRPQERPPVGKRCASAGGGASFGDRHTCGPRPAGCRQPQYRHRHDRNRRSCGPLGPAVGAGAGRCMCAPAFRGEGHATGAARSPKPGPDPRLRPVSPLPVGPSVNSPDETGPGSSPAAAESSAIACR